MNNSIRYKVNLKYIKKSSIPVVREQKLAEFMPVFIVKDNINKDEVVGKVEAKARVFLPEFTKFAKRLGFEISGNKRKNLWSNDDYAYLRLLIYGVVMSRLKTPNEWAQLEDYILTMEPIPLRFWASKFRNTYWKYKNKRKLDYLAKRFLEVEWI